MIIDTRALRDALGQFATGVCLITVNDARSGPLALTANSFASVSLEPALVLWSIQNSSECFREYTSCAHFGISIMTAAQAEHSSRYARRGEHGIDPADFHLDEDGIPRLHHASAWFVCRQHALFPGGDHQIIVGEVLRMGGKAAPPLVFFGGQYRTLADAPEDLA